MGGRSRQRPPAVPAPRGGGGRPQQGPLSSWKSSAKKRHQRPFGSNEKSARASPSGSRGDKAAPREGGGEKRSHPGPPGGWGRAPRLLRQQGSEPRDPVPWAGQGAACGGDDAPVAVRCWLRGAHLPGPPRVRPHDGSLRAASTSRSCLKRNETASCSCKAPMLGGGQRMAPQRPGPILAGGSDPTAIVWAWPTFAPPGAAPSCPRPQGHQGRVPGREAPGPALPAQREPS